jgi:aconitate hydratase
MAQFGPENHADHMYLQSIAPKVGAYHSRPGNGICHQVHLERFARPGRTQLGSDSHTPTAGGMGALAIGAGGLDVAVAMGGGAFFTPCPRVIGVELTGTLQPWVAAKDIILRLLSILTTKGNVGCVVEYHGSGVATLPVPARSTCTNMGAELGVTTSIFPADETTRQFLKAQKREEDYSPIAPDAGAGYDRITKRVHTEREANVLENIRTYCTNVEVCQPDADGYVQASFDKIVIDLDRLDPLAAAPGSPDNIVPISEIAGMKVDQVAVGSCTNSSFQDLTLVATCLNGRSVHPNVEMAVAPGSRQVLGMISDNGALARIVGAGARILESACGPCIGVGFSPAEGAVSLRSFNRNFDGRSGTKGDLVYLVSPETAVAGALAGEVIDPRELPDRFGIEYPSVEAPEEFKTDDSMILQPLSGAQADQAEIIRGPSIVKPPRGEKLPDTLTARTVIKVGDKITTDHIMPAGSLLKYRSNVPEYAKYVFHILNDENEPTFAQRCLGAKDQGQAAAIVAGDSYGQGSSREHAALCPMYLGVKVVIAKAIERIHQNNLVNFAILPLVFESEADYDTIDRDDELVIENVTEAVASGDRVEVHNKTKGDSFGCKVVLSPRQREILAAGGLLNYTRQN